MRFLGVCVLLPVLLAQHAHPPAEKPVALLGGLGKHSLSITTRSPEAQKFFDQGLNLLYGFNRYEAARSFRKAIELDPAAAMAYVGLARATGPHINMDLDSDVDLKVACQTLTQARTILSAPRREKAWVAAAHSACPEDKSGGRYKASLKALAAQYPDDLDIQTFYAEALMIPSRWKWWTPQATPAEGTEEAIRILETVLRRNPNHPGANHLYIHAVEASPTPERAIPSAQRLMGLVPAAGHLVHMPGHIWMVLGEWNLAAEVNERAAQVDQEYMAKTNVMGSYAGYWVHNLHFVAYARTMQGAYEPARKASQAVAAAVAPMTDQMAGMVDAFWPWPAMTAVRFERWDDVLAIKPPPPALRASAVMLHYSRGRAFLNKGQRADAEKELAAVKTSAKAIPADWMWLNNKAFDIANIAALALEAELKASPDLWRQAIAIQDTLIYDEPPPFFYPLRESLAAALLKAGQPAEAEKVLRDLLRRTPNDVRGIRLLRAALRAQKNQEAADLVSVELARLEKAHRFTPAK